MQAGKIDRRITIQRPGAGQDASGQPVSTWQDVATVWAEKVENRGSERFTAQQFTGHAIRTFRIRWSNTVAEVTDKHRIVFDGRNFNITDVREIGRREGIEIDCWAPGEEPLTQ